MSLIEQAPRIETRRLVLRAPRAGDIETIAALADDFDIARMTTGMPHPYRRSDAEAFVARAQTLDPAREAVFVIEREADGAVGVLGLHSHGSPASLPPRLDASKRDETAPVQNVGALPDRQTAPALARRALGPEIGYWIGRPFWGQGIAGEAACAAMAWARRDWRRRAAVAGYFADNPASGRVLERAGFLHTGEIQQRFSLARGEAAPTRMMVWLA